MKTREELISEEAIKLYPKDDSKSLDYNVRVEIERLAFKHGLKSKLNDKLREVDVVDGKIKLMNKLREYYSKNISIMIACSDELTTLFLQREEIIKSLNKA